MGISWAIGWPLYEQIAGLGRPLVWSNRALPYIIVIGLHVYLDFCDYPSRASVTGKVSFLIFQLKKGEAGILHLLVTRADTFAYCEVMERQCQPAKCLHK